jgi:hypothetical protein
MTANQLRRSVQEPESRRFIDAWLGWRGSDLIPGRRALELADIKSMLKLVLLFELRSAAQVYIRVAGTGMRDYLGFELTGSNYMALTPFVDRPVRYFRFRQIADRPCGGVMLYNQRLGSGEVVPSEVVSLPIAPDDPQAPKLVISHATPLGPQPPSPSVPHMLQLHLAEEFRFLDIGAGVPDRIVP